MATGRRKEMGCKRSPSCTDDDTLWRVYYRLVTGLLYLMMTSRRKELVTSPFMLRFLELYELEKDADDYEFRDMCLERDAHRCVVTKCLDLNYWRSHGRPDEDLESVEITRIIPLAYASWRADAMGPNETMSPWDILYRCFPGLRKVGMGIEEIRDMPNALTLSMLIYRLFCRFK